MHLGSDLTYHQSTQEMFELFLCELNDLALILWKSMLIKNLNSKYRVTHTHKKKTSNSNQMTTINAVKEMGYHSQS